MSRQLRDLHLADWVDAAFALVLTGLALAGWHTLFAGSGWWIGGGAAALVGVGVALAAVSAGYGVGLTALILVSGLFLAAGPIATGAVRLGDLQFLGDSVLALSGAWNELVGTHPPVSGRGAVLVAPVMLGLLGAGLSCVLALTSPKPGAPMPPLVTTLVLVLVLGPLEPVSVLLQGSAFAVFAVWWVLLRGARAEARAHGRDPAGVRRVAVAVVLVVAAGALASTLAPAAAGDHRLVARTYVAGFDPAGEVTPLDKFRIYTKQGPDYPGNVFTKRLLQTYGVPSGTRLRFATLTSYDGQTWSAAGGRRDGPADDRFLAVSDQIATEATGEDLSVSIKLTENWAFPWVPIAGDLTSFAFAYGRDDRMGQLRYNPATETALMLDGLTAKDDYAFTSIQPEDLLTRGMEPASGVDPELFRLAEFLAEPLQAWQGLAGTRMEALFRVAAALKSNGRYTDGAEAWTARFRAGHSLERLGKGFVLSVPTAGNDEQYAATMALFAARLDIPARVVVGAVVPKSGIVRGRDVSAWIEVQIEDGSWRTMPTELFMGDRPPPRVEPQGALPSRDFTPPKTQPGQKPPQTQPQTPPTPETEDEKPKPAESSNPWWLLPVGAVLLMAAVPLVKAIRRRRRRGAARVSTRYVGAWAELVDQARDLGVAVPAGANRHVEARAMGLGDSAAWTADRAVFSAEEPSAAEAEEFWEIVAPLRRDLTRSRSEGRSRWRRWWAPFNPRSLFTR